MFGLGWENDQAVWTIGVGISVSAAVVCDLGLPWKKNSADCLGLGVLAGDVGVFVGGDEDDVFVVVAFEDGADPDWREER